jgi:hypothetical protein
MNEQFASQFGFFSDSNLQLELRKARPFQGRLGDTNVQSLLTGCATNCISALRKTPISSL